MKTRRDLTEKKTYINLYYCYIFLVMFRNVRFSNLIRFGSVRQPNWKSLKNSIQKSINRKLD